MIVTSVPTRAERPRRFHDRRAAGVGCLEESGAADDPSVGRDRHRADPLGLADDGLVDSFGRRVADMQRLALGVDDEVAVEVEHREASGARGREPVVAERRDGVEAARRAMLVISSRGAACRPGIAPEERPTAPVTVTRVAPRSTTCSTRTSSVDVLAPARIASPSTSETSAWTSAGVGLLNVRSRSARTSDRASPTALMTSASFAAR